MDEGLGSVMVREDADVWLSLVILLMTTVDIPFLSCVSVALCCGG